MTIFAVLADDRRRQILDLLRAGEQPAGALVDALDVAQPTVSQHLKVLRDAGLVTVRAEGTRRLYRLRPEALREVEAWLEPYRILWAGRLDDLERHLDDMAANEPPRRPSRRNVRRGRGGT
ncbi:MAG: metalloregulator ArsR/SmtB family transcription factor [Acidimicrobiales bacterium]